jgi:hypothetical protein
LSIAGETTVYTEDNGDARDEFALKKHQDWVFSVPLYQLMGANNIPTKDEEVHSELEDSVEDEKGYNVFDSPEDHNNYADDDEYEEVEEDEYVEESIIQEDDLLNVVHEVLKDRKLAERRPLPVLVKGKEVDLVKLSVQVRALGGYDRVTTWSLLSKSMGFGSEGGPLLKLVYVKYLKAIENRRLVPGPARSDSNPSSAINMDFLQNIENREHSIVPNFNSSCTSSSVQVQWDPPVTTKRSLINEAEEKPSLDLPYLNPLQATSFGIPPQESVVLDESSHSLVLMLEWVKRVALNPGDRKRGRGSRSSRGNETLYLALSQKVRMVLFRNIDHVPNPRSESPVSVI